MTQIRLKNILLAACTLIFGSCAVPYANIPLDYQLKESTGVMLLSLTASGECGYAYFIEIRNINSKQEYSIGMQDFGQDREWKKSNTECPSEPNDIFGKLAVNELPPGNYELFQLEGISSNRRIYSENEMSIHFDIKANKVNYLGNIHFHVNKKSFNYKAQDLGQRDIPLFLNKYVQFSKQNIIVNLLRMNSATRLIAAAG